MKRRKRIAAGLLALALLPGLAACGKGKTPQATEAGPAAGTETVYVPEFTAVREDGENRLTPLLYTEEGIYAQSREKVGEEIPEGVTPQYQDQYAVYAYRQYFISSQGELRLLEGYGPAASAEEPEGVRDFSTEASIVALFQRQDGKLLALESVSSSYYDGPEELRRGDEGYWDHVVEADTYYVGALEPDGTRISAAPVALEEDLFLQRDSVVLDGQGHIVIAYNTREGDEYGLLSLAEDGALVYRLKTENYVNELVRLRDGRAALFTWDRPEGVTLTAVDGESGQLAESYRVPREVYGALSGSGDYDFYYTYGVKLFGYSLERGEADEILDWIACDMDSSRASQASIAEDGTVRVLLNTWEENGQSARACTELATLRRESAAAAPQKEHLTLAALYLDEGLKKEVIDFNRHSDTCRIDLKYYSEYNTENDYSAGRTKLTTEILAGNLPDLIVLDELPYDQMAAKGMLEDLYPWLDKDGELSRADFYDNVLRAMETNGGLYMVSPGFSLITVLGAKSVVGDRTGWTYDELYAALDTMPEGCEILGSYETAEDVLTLGLCTGMEDYIDWESGHCSFDSPAFLQLLEFAGRFPLEPSQTEQDSEMDRIAQGKQMLMGAGVYDFSDLQMSELLFGGEGSVSYIGLPTADGSSGSAIYCNQGLAMSSRCADKEAAWSFLRRFLTEEHQTGQDAGLPTNWHAFEKALEEAATPEYETDGQGHILLDENGEPIEKSRGGMASSDGFSASFYSLSQDQVETLRNLVENTARPVRIHETVLELVLQEAMPYFSGQKTAQEVASLIQSKLNLYVNEQK